MKEILNDENIEMVSGGRRRPRSPEMNDDPFFAGIVECGTCGNQMEKAEAETKTVGGVTYYHCTACDRWVDADGNAQPGSAGLLGNFVPGK